MTKLKPDVKPQVNKHTLKDADKARQHLNRLTAILKERSTPDITVIRKRVVKEVEM